MRSLILPLFIVLSMPVCAWGQGIDAQNNADVGRCVVMRYDSTEAQKIGYALKRHKNSVVDVDDAPITIQPRMAGLRGPSVTFLGRDVRLATALHQSSPQELWQKAQWNQTYVPCAGISESWRRSLKRGYYWNTSLATDAGVTTYQPKILYRTRFAFNAMVVRPYGFTFGIGGSTPAATNTDALLYLPDTRPAVRRDMARFSRGGSMDRLYASWRTTPITDLHLSLTAGWLEEMYGGVGAETVYRPFGSAFWVGADGWQVWRRDADTLLNIPWTAENTFTGHVRVGYDMPDSRFGVSVAAGRYLAGDKGVSVEANQGFANGARVTASLTWTNRDEAEGFFKNSHYDPMVRLVWPLGRDKHHDTSTTLRQVGRDGGQMLDRPQPLERVTDAFSGREVIRYWPQMFEGTTP